jgi:hypothetical protein
MNASLPHPPDEFKTRYSQAGAAIMPVDSRPGIVEWYWLLGQVSQGAVLCSSLDWRLTVT